jgi:hypothetical protein
MTRESTDSVSCRSCGADIVALLKRHERYFWMHVEKGEGCWLWLGQLHRHGYGMIQLPGLRLLAHRAAWILVHGWIERREHVLHRCDNPPCVNPAHLSIGSHLDNVADMVAKGRQSRGARHAEAVRAALSNLRLNNPEKLDAGIRRGVSNGNAKLTDREVRIIRGCEGSSPQVSRIFGVSAAVVRDVRLRRRWRHVD